MGDHGLYGELKTKLRDCLHPDYNFRYPKNEKVISCEENKNSIRCTVNPEEIACLFVVDEQFDGSCKLDNPCNCLGSSNSCDLILYMNTGRLKTVTFVELKGTNVNHAILQIKETIKNFKDKFDKQQWRYKVLAVIPDKMPTISTLSDEKWGDLIVILKQERVRELIPEFKKFGAAGIVEFPLNKFLE